MSISLPKWVQNLRQCEINQKASIDPRSIGGTILGVDANHAMREVAGWGQADFDVPLGTLTPDDRVLLYAYYFQRGHLEELVEAFRQLFVNSCPENPIVIDLGCGPFTGGLAVASVMNQEARFSYIGIDQSAAMCRLGKRLAIATEDSAEAPSIDHRWYTDITSVSWRRAPGWRPVIVIVSYLLASRSLKVIPFVAKVEKLISRLSGGSVTVLYTNSTTDHANQRFPDFSNALVNVGFRLIADDIGSIEIERLFGERIRYLRYALFFRKQNDILKIEGI